MTKPFSAPRWLFVPPEAGSGGDRAWRRVVQNLYDRLERIRPTLMMCRSPKSLADFGRPGLYTLYSPHFPRYESAAVAASDAVVSFSLAIARKARRCGVPVLYLGPETAEFEGVDRLAGDRADLCERALDWTPAPRRPFFSPSSAVFPKTGNFRLACIADKKFLPFFLGLTENIKRFSPGPEKIFLLCLDEETRDFFAGRPDIQTLTLADLWAGEELRGIRGRSVAHRAYASKARLLRRVLTERGGPVFYLDLDLYFFHSPAELTAELGDGNVLLFPQWNDRLESSWVYGMFNAGLVVVRTGAEDFLDWWSERCLYDYREEARAGYYVDQGVLDLAPLYFRGVRIYRKAEHNVAPWNIESLLDPGGSARSRPGARYPLNHGGELRSFHAAGPDPIGIFENKFIWDQVVTFFSAVPRTWLTEVEANVVEQQRHHWLALSRWMFLRSRLPGRVAEHRRVVAAAGVFLRGGGSVILSALAKTHYRFRKRKPSNPSVPDGRWVSFQRGFIAPNSPRASSPGGLEPGATENSPPAAGAHDGL